MAAADVLWSPRSFRKFPDADGWRCPKVASAGCRTCLERCRLHLPTTRSLGRGTDHRLVRPTGLRCSPNTSFVCFIDDAVGVENSRTGSACDRHHCGRCDYPHPDTTWPESPEVACHEVAEPGAGPADDRLAITHLNAMRYFDLRPCSPAFLDRSRCWPCQATGWIPV